VDVLHLEKSLHHQNTQFQHHACLIAIQTHTHTGQQGRRRRRTHLILGTQHNDLGHRAERLHQLKQIGLRRTADDKEKRRHGAWAVKKEILIQKNNPITPDRRKKESKKRKVGDLAPVSHLGDLLADVPDVDHLGRLRHPPELETTQADHR
jgi:hypothetical protein